MTEHSRHDDPHRALSAEDFERLQIAEDARDHIMRWLKLLVAATVVLYIATGTIGLLTMLSAQQTHSALCKFHDDLGNRIAQSQQILNSPQGPNIIRNFGLTPAQIHNQVQGQQRTYDSLNALHCN